MYQKNSVVLNQQAILDRSCEEVHHMEDEVRYYYDSHETEKDRMGEPLAHRES